MENRSVIKRHGIVPVTLFLLCFALNTVCMAAGPERITVSSVRAEKLSLMTGQSVILESQAPIKRIAVAAPAVADAMVLTPYQVYLTGKTAGLTTITLWNEGDRVSAVFDAEVLPDLGRLKTRLRETFPKEKEVQVTATHDGLTLSGMVSSTAALSQVLALAQAYAPVDKDGKSKVVNLLEVGGVHQVMLEVRVAEMSRSLTRQLGINFATVSASGQQFGVSLLNQLISLPQQGFPGNPLGVSSSVNGILRFLGGGASWTVFIDALKDNGLVKVLAEPTLITLSGKSANFLAGGEYPIPVPQASGVASIITIEYKTFGVGLSFTPTVLSNSKINMVVAPEVSDLDFTQAVSLQGYIIPSLTTRRVSTTVELADGQSFAIAGLLRENVRENIRKFPVLGDIPILGVLFRSSSFQKNETELVVIVTPHLVKPLDMAKQPLPTDQFIEPDDVEFYLMGRLEGEPKEKSAPATGKTASMAPGRKGGLDGDFGHIVP